ncbi:transcriptional regulator [Lactobacillus sp. AN1001]
MLRRLRSTMGNFTNNESYIAFHPGYYVEKYLDHHGMKQSELAERLGVSEKTVSHLINGKNKQLSRELIDGLSRVLGTSKELWINLNNKYLETLKKIKV